jgi:hypothetical protein
LVLGARPSPIGWLLSLAKRFRETPETCADRRGRVLARPRWSPPGDARWSVEEREQPWPDIASAESTRRAVREATERLLS